MCEVLIKQIEDNELNIYWEFLVRHEYAASMV